MTEPTRGNPLQRLPIPVFFVVVLLLWVTLQTVFSSEPIDVVTTSIRVLGGLVFATVTTVPLAVRRRRLGGTDPVLAFARAVRTGVVPEGATTTGWSAELDRAERRLRWNRWFVRIAGLFPFGLGVWGVTQPDSRVLGVVLAAGMVAGWVWTEIATPRTLDRMERLRASLPA